MRMRMRILIIKGSEKYVKRMGMEKHLKKEHPSTRRRMKVKG